MTWILALSFASVARAQDDGETPTPLLGDARQLTLEGLRSGEGYFNSDGSLMVFQSEREDNNPFYQIYLMDMETGDVERVSDGTGKTTCAWIYPDDQHVLFASTQLDPAAIEKQKAELEFRASGQTRRYSWDYDPAYDLLVWDRQTQEYTRLTTEEGYDAEGSVSPDGQKIVFASNRQAYQKELTATEKELLERDPSYFMELYLMDSDGQNVERLTDAPGYDGGPFFSADGRKICWRRFSENGAMAEIMTMDLDSRTEKQLTRLNKMSWAPYFHPSGDYLIFTTNVHGFGNFELYLVAADGGPPIRVTDSEGFDGLPVFSPDGQQLVWTSNRNSRQQSQLYVASWNHEAALQRLGLEVGETSSVATSEQLEAAEGEARKVFGQLTTSISPQDVMRHVAYLCRDELGGRGTGTQGERMATAYIASIFDQLGLEPAGPEGSWFQEFEFTAGVRLGDGNQARANQESLKLGTDWQPVGFSASGSFDPAQVVFAGYGMTVPQTETSSEYDSYVHIDVRDKWVLVFRFMPEDVGPERRLELARYQALHRKAAIAREKGARGLIIVSGPQTTVRNELIPLAEASSFQSSSLPIVSVSNEVATAWLATVNRDLAKLQRTLDMGDMMMGIGLQDVQFAAEIDIEKIRKTGRNVLGRLPAGESETWKQAVLVGAHVDHLGRGRNSSSLAGNVDEDVIHYGADDNASGISAMLEMAQYLSSMKSAGKLELKRDVVFAAWSGEELGLLGAQHFAKEMLDSLPDPVADDSGETPEKTLAPRIAANLNLDMVGRLRDNLVLQGLGSSDQWRAEIEKRNVPVGLSLVLQDDCDLPTDASVFYRNGVPILAAFTGSHQDYHKPTDTPEKLDYDGAARVARLMALIARGLATADDPIAYRRHTQEQENSGVRAVLRAYLGTIPEYGADEVKGVLLSDVTKGAPAEKAGLKGGDIIVELAGKPIDNIYDYTYAIEALKVGETTTITVMRDGERLLKAITPGSRD